MKQKAKIKELKDLVRKNKRFTALFILLIIIAVIFRYYNYTNRIIVTGDNGRDAQIALYAHDNLKIPQIGPFAQAPFFFGPFWYWFLTLTYYSPFGLFSPWYFLSVLGLLYIVVLYCIGCELENKWLGLLLSFLVTISPFAINNYFLIWNPSVIPILSALIILVFLKFYKNNSSLKIVTLGFLISLATTIHFQAFLLLPIGIIAITTAKERIKNIVFFVSGSILPFIPFLIFDIRHYWFWSRSAAIYFLIDQPSKAFPYRWLTYFTDFLPNIVRSIFETNKSISLLIIIGILVTNLIFLKRFKIYKNYYYIMLAFFMDLILIRYYKGPKEVYYFLFIYTFFILSLGWSLFKLIKFNKIIGILFILTITFYSLKADINQLHAQTLNVNEIQAIKEQIYQKYPHKPISIFGCVANGGTISHPLGLLIYADKKYSVIGVKFGVCEISGNQFLFELSEDQIGDAWANQNTDIVYNEALEWWKNRPPQKDPNFWNFILRKMSPSCYPHCP